jgi:hypothetical protein
VPRRNAMKPWVPGRCERFNAKYIKSKVTAKGTRWRDNRVRNIDTPLPTVPVRRGAFLSSSYKKNQTSVG